MKNKIIRRWNCFCGVSFEGTEEQYNIHLQNFCPVYQDASLTLQVEKNLKELLISK